MAYPNPFEEIDKELREIHTYLRTQPVTSEDKRMVLTRVDILLERRQRIAVRESAATMIGDA